MLFETLDDDFVKDQKIFADVIEEIKWIVNQNFGTG